MFQKQNMGDVDFSEDFFGKPTNLTVSGQLNGETYRYGISRRYIHLDQLLEQKIQIQQDMQQNSG